MPHLKRKIIFAMIGEGTSKSHQRISSDYMFFSDTASIIRNQLNKIINAVRKILNAG